MTKKPQEQLAAEGRFDSIILKKKQKVLHTRWCWMMSTILHAFKKVKCLWKQDTYVTSMPDIYHIAKTNTHSPNFSGFASFWMLAALSFWPLPDHCPAEKWTFYHQSHRALFVCWCFLLSLISKSCEFMHLLPALPNLQELWLYAACMELVSSNTTKIWLSCNVILHE